MHFMTSILLSAMAVAPRDIAITVAITHDDHAIIVTDIRDDGVRGVDVTDALDHVSFFAAADWASTHAVDLARRPAIDVGYAALQPAGGLGEHHVAAAINYVDHARETALTPGEVFVFPKIGRSTGPFASVTAQADELLDWEVELCVRFDRTLSSTVDLKDARAALFLCHDWSERAVVVREFDEKHPKTAGGFTKGKSHPGYYQSSSIVLVPHDWRKLATMLTLELRVDGVVRQSGKTSEMILHIDELAALALERGAAPEYRTYDGFTAVLPHAVIEPEMTVLTGTPAGVAFSPPSTWFRMVNGIEYFVTGLFGPFYRTSPRGYVLEEYIAKLIAERVFLQPGQVVVSSGTYLGTLEAHIVSAASGSQR